jgi:PAS domain S-box-containing protein
VDQQELSDLRLVARTTAAMAAASDLEGALRALLAGLRHLTGAELGGVRLLQAPGQFMGAVRLYFWRGENDYAWTDVQNQPGSNTVLALERGEGVSTPDLAALAATGDQAAQIAHGRDRMASSLIVPLRAGGELIGTLHADAHRPHAFPDALLMPMQVLADHAGGAVAQAHLVTAERATRAQLTEALRENEKQFRRLVDHSPEANVVLISGTFVYVNSAAVRLYHADSAADLTGHLVGDVLPLNGRDGVLALVSADGEHVLTGEPVEQRHTRLDGQPIDVDVIASAITYHGQPATLLIIRDITERKRLEAERRLRERAEAARVEAEARAKEARTLADVRAVYEAAVVNLGEGIVLFDRDDRIVFANPYAETLFDVPTGHMLAWTMEEYRAFLGALASDPQELLQQGEAAYLAASTGVAGTYSVRLMQDPPRDLQVLIFPITGTEGPLGHGRLIRDVTQERELDRLKDELVSAVSHELRTPLASIVGFAELLLSREYPETQRRRYLSVMHQEGVRLTTLINDFLDLQRMESGQQRFTPTTVDVRSLCERAIEVAGDDPLRPVTLSLAEDLPPVLVDSAAIQQVLLNLISNARKYSPNGGTITLSARQIDTMVELAVQDRGLGLPPEVIPQLFARFYRVDNTDRSEIRGTGLGLAICRKIVEAHHGRIWAESDGLGQGSTFRLSLPIAPATPQIADVLIVEDDKNFAQLLEAELTAKNHTAISAATVDAALDWYMRARPQAVLLDLHLPGDDGWLFLRRLRASGAALVPVVVVTGQDLVAKEHHGLQGLGVLLVIEKGPGAATEAAWVLAEILAKAP